MLFTDNDLVTIADLSAIDSEVSDVAQAENLTFSGDNSIIRTAYSDAASHLLSALQSFAGYLASPAVSTSHVSAVLNTGQSSISRPRLRLSNIVTNGAYPGVRTPLLRWMDYLTLYTLFRAAMNRKLSDRYSMKLELYKIERDAAWGRLTDQGLPMVLEPLPCPGAIHEMGAGTFAVSAISGSGTSAASYDVVLSWVDRNYVSPFNRGNGESGPSARTRVTVANNEVVRVDITGLTPPAAMPAVGLADGITSYRAAVGWNVYAGPVGGLLTLQNASPLPIATKTYTLPSAPTTNGVPVSDGQYADVNLAFQRILQRG